MRVALVLLVVSLFGVGLVSLRGLSGAVELRGTRQSDTRISAAVRTELAAVDGSGASRFDVETQAGVVRLTGTAASEAIRRDLVRRAQASPGVSLVLDELIVGPLGR